MDGGALLLGLLLVPLGAALALALVGDRRLAPENVRLKIHEVRDATPEDALNTGIHAISRMMN